MRSETRRLLGRLLIAFHLSVAGPGPVLDASLGDGRELEGRRLLLATGVVDDLPDIPGVAEAWGRTAVHCPYCHGHELRGRRTVVLAAGEAGFEVSRLITGWTEHITLCSDGPSELSAEQRRALADHGIDVREEPVDSIEVDGDEVIAVAFATGERIPCGAVYVRPVQRLRGDLAGILGVEVGEEGLIRVDESGQTSVPGVYACGDVTTRMQMVITAAATGATTGAMINHELIVRARAS